MQLVKVKPDFFEECKKRDIDKEILYNEAGRPGVLLVKMKYKGKNRSFVVPIRSNISSKTPKEQYLSLPPNPNTRKGCAHGVHYIKMFPIDSKYIDNYLIDKSTYMLQVKAIIDRKEFEIVRACQEYLRKCEDGKKHMMTPDIDGILCWLEEQVKEENTDESDRD